MLASELIAELQKLMEKSGKDLPVIVAWHEDYEDHCKYPVPVATTNDIEDIPELFGEIVICLA